MKKRYAISLAVFVVAGCIAALALSSGTSTTTLFKSNLLSSDFYNFIQKYQKSYKTLDELKLRFAIFNKNFDLITEHNLSAELKGLTFTVGINKFSDWTEEELITLHGGKQIEEISEDASLDLQMAGAIPVFWDWRALGKVPPVRSQKCQDCWANAGTAAVETAWAIKSNRLPNLSVQQVVDCCNSERGFRSSGCNGGREEEVALFSAMYGIVPASVYPYIGEDGFCQTSKLGASYSIKISGAYQVTSQSKYAMLSALSQGPVTISISAASFFFHHYTGGVMNTPTCASTPTNHAVLGVGYGYEGQQYYIIIQNSWGTDWGEAGYIRVSAEGFGNGICNIFQHPYAVVAY